MININYGEMEVGFLIRFTRVI